MTKLSATKNEINNNIMDVSPRLLADIEAVFDRLGPSITPQHVHDLNETKDDSGKPLLDANEEKGYRRDNHRLEAILQYIRQKPVKVYQENKEIGSILIQYLDDIEDRYYGNSFDDCQAKEEFENDPLVQSIQKLLNEDFYTLKDQEPSLRVKEMAPDPKEDSSSTSETKHQTPIQNQKNELIQILEETLTYVPANYPVYQQIIELLAKSTPSKKIKHQEKVINKLVHDINHAMKNHRVGLVQATLATVNKFQQLTTDLKYHYILINLTTIQGYIKDQDHSLYNRLNQAVENYGQFYSDFDNVLTISLNYIPENSDLSTKVKKFLNITPADTPESISSEYDRFRTCKNPDDQELHDEIYQYLKPLIDTKKEQPQALQEEIHDYLAHFSSTADFYQENKWSTQFETILNLLTDLRNELDDIPYYTRPIDELIQKGDRIQNQGTNKAYTNKEYEIDPFYQVNKALDLLNQAYDVMIPTSIADIQLKEAIEEFLQNILSLNTLENNPYQEALHLLNQIYNTADNPKSEFMRGFKATLDELEGYPEYDDYE